MTAFKPLTYDERKAGEEAFRWYSADPYWTNPAEPVAQGSLDQLLGARPMPIPLTGHPGSIAGDNRGILSFQLPFLFSNDPPPSRASDDCLHLMGSVRPHYFLE
jgi:hypothetical protein